MAVAEKVAKEVYFALLMDRSAMVSGVAKKKMFNVHWAFLIPRPLSTLPVNRAL